MIVIDSDNYAGVGIETLFFPGGEPHMKFPKKWKDSERVVAHLKLRTWNDVAFGACVLDILERRHTRFVDAFIPYFPGARQDKPYDYEAPFTLAIMENLLTFSTANLWVFDPHSGMLPDMAADCRVLMPSDLGERMPLSENVVGIIAPDEGALSRAEDFRDAFYPNAHIVECYKERDPRTGRLSGYQMEPLRQGGRHIVVDDICDGGGTFNLLAEAFESDMLAEGSELELFVSHGIFSKGLQAISPRYSKITTTDSFCRGFSGGMDDGRLTVIPLLHLMEGETP